MGEDVFVVVWEVNIWDGWDNFREEWVGGWIFFLFKYYIGKS